MSNESYRYGFNNDVPMDQVEETLLLSTLAVESLQGRSGIRLDAEFQLEKEKRTCRISSTTEAGRQLARIFTGFLAREFGEQAFRVDRGESDDRRRT